MSDPEYENLRWIKERIAQEVGDDEELAKQLLTKDNRKD